MPLLAQSWSLSGHKKTYTFKTQDNAKFYDGHPMTAALLQLGRLIWTAAVKARHPGGLRLATSGSSHRLITSSNADKHGNHRPDGEQQCAWAQKGR